MNNIPLKIVYKLSEWFYYYPRYRNIGQQGYFVSTHSYGILMYLIGEMN